MPQVSVCANRYTYLAPIGDGQPGHDGHPPDEAVPGPRGGEAREPLEETGPGPEEPAALHPAGPPDAAVGETESD